MLLAARGGSYEGAAALAGDDEAALAQHLHGVPDGLVGNAVLFRQGALRRQLVADLADFDPGRDVIGDLDVGEVWAEWIDLGHVINVDTLLAA